MRGGVIVLLVLVVHTTYAQGTREDYQRARTWASLTRGKVTRAEVRPHWSEDGQRFWYRLDVGPQREFFLVDAARGERRPAFVIEKLAPELAKVLGGAVSARDITIDRLAFGASGNLVLVMAEKAWEWDETTSTLKPVAVLPPPPKPAPKSIGRRERAPRPAQSAQHAQHARPAVSAKNQRLDLFVKDYNIWMRGADGQEQPLTTNGNTQHYFENRLFWSPDRQKVVALKTRPAQEHPVYLLESSPADQVQPKLHRHDYLKPGDRIAQSKPHLFDTTTKKEIAVADTLFANPWSIDNIRWSADSREISFLYNQRGHQVIRVIAVNSATGAARAIIDEPCATFFDYAHKLFYYPLQEGSEIIWMSERDGWNHLYLHDAQTGKVKNQITRGPWVVRGVDRVDEKNRQVYLRVGGYYPQQDPYYVHYARVDFDGKNWRMLTEGDGTHAIEYSPQRDYYLDRYSRVDLPTVTELRRSRDGSLVCGLEKADASALSALGWRPPERFVAKGRDGKTDIYGLIFRPSRFDEKKKYPVIEHIYAGPQGAFTPKRFQEYYSHLELAELGFIVVQMDGMGTALRSKAFHDVCWKNLGDAGFPDRIAWIKAAAAKYPAMDLTRVGIYGGSAGGQSSTAALLFHPDFYHVAVSDCGCHDNRMDKIWWNELWMSWPMGQHYAAQSNVTNAHRLRGRLLLIVGELDRNVDPASTLQVVNALIKANKEFDFLLVPGGGHGIAESPYGRRRRQDYFVRHLLGVEPPNWNQP